jgi:hypothetical protein
VSQPRGHQQAAHDAHRRHQPLRKPPAASGTPDPCGPEHRPATGRVDDQPGEMPDPNERGDGSKHPSTPRSENRKPSLSQSARPAPARPERRHIALDKPRQDHQRPRRNRQHQPPRRPAAIRTDTANSANNIDPKPGVIQMLKTPRQAPKDRPAMSKPTTYNSNPVKSGEVTETRQAIKRGLKKYHPHQRRQPQTPTTTGDPPPGFPARACARPIIEARGVGERRPQQRQSADPGQRPRNTAAAPTRAKPPATDEARHPSHRRKWPTTPG